MSHVLLFSLCLSSFLHSFLCLVLSSFAHLITFWPIACLPACLLVHVQVFLGMLLPIYPKVCQVYPAITIFNLICLGVTLNQLLGEFLFWNSICISTIPLDIFRLFLINFNDFFFGVVNAFEMILKRTEQVSSSRHFRSWNISGRGCILDVCRFVVQVFCECTAKWQKALIGVAALCAIGVVWKSSARNAPIWTWSLAFCQWISDQWLTVHSIAGRCKLESSSVESCCGLQV